MPKTRTIYKCTEKSWRRLNANSTWPSIRLVTRLFLTKHPTLFIGHFSWSQRNHSNGGQIPNQRRVWATHWIVWMPGGVCHCCWSNSGRKVRLLIAIILCNNNNTSPLHQPLPCSCRYRRHSHQNNRCIQQGRYSWASHFCAFESREGQRCPFTRYPWCAPYDQRTWVPCHV